MPGREFRQQRAVRADGERHDGADHDEEQHQRQRVAAAAGREPAGRGR